MAKSFYCYVFEMTTERIVSSYVINERNKKGGGGEGMNQHLTGS